MRRRAFLGVLAGMGAMAALSPSLPVRAADTPGQGMLTFVFDDGLASVHKYALPILKGRNQPAVAAIVANRVTSGNDDYMGLNQVQALQDAGWEIASHGLCHVRPISVPGTYEQEPIQGLRPDPGNPGTFQALYEYDLITGVYQDNEPLSEVDKLEEMATLPGTYYYDRPIAELRIHPFHGGEPEELGLRAGSYQREMEASKRVLTDHGFKITSHVAPYNYWPNDMKALAKLYYAQAATGGDKDNKPGDYDRYAIRRFIVHHKDSANTLIRLVKEHVQGHGAWTVLCLHGVEDQVGWEPWAAKHLDALSAFAAEAGIPVVTLDEGVRRMG